MTEHTGNLQKFEESENNRTQKCDSSSSSRFLDELRSATDAGNTQRSSGAADTSRADNRIYPNLILTNERQRQPESGQNSRETSNRPDRIWDSGSDRYRYEKPNHVIPMSDKELDAAGKKIADQLLGKKDFGSFEEREKFEKMFADAEKSGQLKELVAAVNAELARQHSDLNLQMKSTYRQSMGLPELSPFTSWNDYKLSLVTDEGDALDAMGFSGKETYHPGMYPRYEK
jgi:hypothetical protein